MSHLLQTLTAHFNPLHLMLCDWSEKANEMWIEGGMIWNVDYRHGMAHTVKIDDTYITRPTAISEEISLQEYKHLWAKLIWRTHGGWGNLENISGEADWEEEENRCIAEFYEQAQQVIALFEGSSADLVRMSFIDDDISLSATCVSLFGSHALVHEIFWSVD